jgi:hypothetical protein
VNNAVKVDAVEAARRESGEILGSANPSFEPSMSLSLCKFGAVRKRIDGDHFAGWPHNVGHIGSEKPGATTDVQDCVPSLDGKVGNEQLTVIKLTLSHAVVRFGKLSRIECKTDHLSRPPFAITIVPLPRRKYPMITPPAEGSVDLGKDLVERVDRPFGGMSAVVPLLDETEHTSSLDVQNATG